MIEALTSVWPVIVLIGVAVLVSALPRRTGHLLGVLGGLLIVGLMLLVPFGAHLETRLFGFDAVMFHVDVYSRLLGLIFGFIAAVGVAYLYATGADRRQTAYALGYIGTALGATLAGDWLSFVVFWELMALLATVLIWHRSEDWKTGIRYAIYHEIGGLILIAGVLFHFAEAGTFVFGAGVSGSLASILVAIGIGLNAGFLGLHVWLVDTYPRTHVATSVVLAAVTTKVGAYAIVRAFPNGHLALAYMGGLMVLFGVTFAILQTDMRRLLSYHIISQVGYMVAGFSAGVAIARAGAIAHLVNNILYKSLLFMIAGVLIHRTGKESLKKLGRLGWEMPIAAVVYLIAAFSIIGLPGFNGFISKGLILDGIEKAGLEPLWYMLVIGGVGTVISFSKFGYYAFYHGDETPNHRDLRPLELGTLGVVALACILLGVFPPLLFEFLPAAGISGAKPFAAKQFHKVGLVTATGIILFFAIRARLSKYTPVPDLDIIYNPIGNLLLALGTAGASTIERGFDRIGKWVQHVVQSLLIVGSKAHDQERQVIFESIHSIGAGILAIAIVTTFLLLISII